MENAIEIRNLSKNFSGKYAVDGLNMTVPKGAIYGFIGENGSGKSTTEKMICGLLIPTSGTIKLSGKDNTDVEVRKRVNCLIEAPGCFPNMSVWNNLTLEATNLGLNNPAEEIAKVLKSVHMEGSASNKFRNCSLGMKQRIGIAMALLGKPEILVLDEPINGLDADGMRIMREILTDITKNYDCTVLISSHILGELEKIATHYGIIKHGKMIKEMTAKEFENECPRYILLKTKDLVKTNGLLLRKFDKVLLNNENSNLRIYDDVSPEEVVTYLKQNGDEITEIRLDKISLEEFYINLNKEAR